MPSLELPARPENLETLRRHAKDMACGCGLSALDAARIEVVMEELLTNIIRYAYPERPGPVCVDCSYDGEYFRITLTDKGQPFNMLDRPPPDLTLDVEERDIGGLGIHMTKKIMQDIRYERKDGHNVLSLTYCPRDK